MNARTIAQATSMRDAILGLIQDDIRSIEMQVVQEEPLRLQDMSDEKLILEGDILVVPRWVSDFEVEVEAKFCDCEHCHTGPLKMEIRNHLKVGERVIVFEVGRDRKYIVFDRRAGQ